MTTPPAPDHIQGIFHGRIFSVVIESVTLPRGEHLDVEVVRHPGSVALIPMNDSGEILLVRQYRHAIAQWVWELPAGILKPGEDPEQAASRECHEEVGLIPDRLEKVGAFFPTPGYCDEELHVFRATQLRRPRNGEVATPDDDEDIEVRAFSPAAIRQMIAAGEIIDLKTVAGISLI